MSTPVRTYKSYFQLNRVTKNRPKEVIKRVRSSIALLTLGVRPIAREHVAFRVVPTGADPPPFGLSSYVPDVVVNTLSDEPLLISVPTNIKPYNIYRGK